MRPRYEEIAVLGNTMMETWSITVDNSDDSAIGPGEEDQIGSRENPFFGDDLDDSWG